MHDYDEQVKTSVQQSINIAKSKGFDEYQHLQSLSGEVNALKAKVVQSDNELVLVSCDDIELRLSHELLVFLDSRKQLPAALMRNDPVELALNQHGYIVGIKKTPALPKCQCNNKNRTRRSDFLSRVSSEV